MAEITASMVKDLRTRTGAGMMDCKKALAEANGDIDAAVDWLRTKGLAAAAKKAGRVAADGLVGVSVDGRRGAIVEINSETDFVARNEEFQALVNNVVGAALTTDGTMDSLSAANYPGEAATVADAVTQAVAKIGEKIELRRSATVNVENGVVGSYVHNAAAPGMGKIGVLVALESTGDQGKLEDLAKQLAMHIAASNPLAIDVEDLDTTVTERERAVLQAKAEESGKPANVVEKMVEGGLQKFFKEAVLLRQPFVMDGKTPITTALQDAAKDIGGPVTVSAFVRFQVGEGVKADESEEAA